MLVLLAASALSNRGRRTRLGSKQIDVQKSITIHAPVADVFAYLADVETFPELMEHVESVKITGERRSRWRVRGPFGTSLAWDAETTRLVPDEVVAWRTLPGSSVAHSGSIRLERAHEQTTRVHVRMTYAPPFGLVGHGVAAIFGVDPKKALDDDLLRLKSLLEHGSATAHGRRVTREEIPVAPFV